MKGQPIYYRSGYKYQLTRNWTVDLNDFLPFPGIPFPITTDFITLTPDGIMTFRASYAWDGCSGPTLDDDTNMRGGLAHDGLYQLLRLGLIPPSFRDYADKILKNVCLDDGMVDVRAWLYHEGVDKFAAGSAEKGYEPYPEQMSPNPKKKQPKWQTDTDWTKRPGP